MSISACSEINDVVNAYFYTPLIHPKVIAYPSQCLQLYVFIGIEDLSYFCDVDVQCTTIVDGVITP